MKKTTTMVTASLILATILVWQGGAGCGETHQRRGSETGPKGGSSERDGECSQGFRYGQQGTLSESQTGG